MTEAIDQMLDELVAGAVHTEIHDTGLAYNFTLSLAYTIDVPALALPRQRVGCTPGSIRWHELIRALSMLDVARDKLRPLQRCLIRDLLQPLIQFHDSAVLNVNFSGDYASAQQSSITLSTNPAQAQGQPG